MPFNFLGITRTSDRIYRSCKQLRKASRMALSRLYNYNTIQKMIFRQFLQSLLQTLHCSPVENKNDLELDFKVFFFTDSCCSDIVDDESK